MLSTIAEPPLALSRCVILQQFLRSFVQIFLILFLVAAWVDRLGGAAGPDSFAFESYMSTTIVPTSIVELVADAMQPAETEASTPKHSTVLVDQPRSDS